MKDAATIAMDAHLQALRDGGRDGHADELQSIRDSWHEKAGRQALETHPMYGALPIQAMLDRGWIRGDTVEEIEASLFRFMGCDSLEQLAERLERWRQLQTCAIECDGCGTKSERGPVAKVRDDLRNNHGWQVDDVGDRDLCPKCASPTPPAMTQLTIALDGAP